MELQNLLRQFLTANSPIMAKEAEQKMRSAEKATTGMKKRSVGYQLYRNRWLYLMLLLPIVYFAMFKFGPIYGLQIAFRNFRVRKGIWGSEWVGLKYFRQYLADPSFWNLVKNTVLLGLGQIVFVFPCPIIFALLLNEIRSKGGQRLVQNISYLPHFISVVVVASMVTTFLAKDGIINKLVMMTGGRLHLYMQDPAWFRPIYWISGLWQELGWSAIIYFAALTNVDSQQYEAAVIDGANRWQQTIHVTLPAIKPTIAIMLIMAMGQMMNVSFEKVLLLQNELTYDVSDVISTFVYRKGLSGGQYSYSTAIDMFSTVTNFVMLVIANRVCQLLGEASLW